MYTIHMIFLLLPDSQFINIKMEQIIILLFDI